MGKIIVVKALSLVKALGDLIIKLKIIKLRALVLNGKGGDELRISLIQLDAVYKFLKKQQEAIQCYDMISRRNKDEEMRILACLLAVPILIEKQLMAEARQNCKYIIDNTNNKMWDKESRLYLGLIG